LAAYAIAVRCIRALIGRLLLHACTARLPHGRAQPAHTVG
jgi:hypothetical protein